MLKKIISIKNVGRFRNSTGRHNPSLPRHVLVLGANGFGKTTLCAILRSLQTGDSRYVVGRRTLGQTAEPTIDLLTDAGTVRFNGQGWSQPLPGIAVFDSTFIDENVHSGDSVESEHRRRLYRIILGSKGVGLAEDEARLAAESRATTSTLTSLRGQIHAHIPSGVEFASFLGLAADAEIETRVTEHKGTLEAVRQVHEIRSRPALMELTLPAVPDGVSKVLAKTIDDIAHDAERRVSQHLTAHRMVTRGEAWLAEGMGFIVDDACPFCDQSLRGLPLIAVYRGLFGNAYAQLKRDVEACRSAVADVFGDAVIGRWLTQIASNTGNLEFWGRYCMFPRLPSFGVPDLEQVVTNLRTALLALLDRKAAAPLESIALDADPAFSRAAAEFDRIRAAVDRENTVVDSTNAIIAAKKSATAVGDVKTEQATLQRLLAVKKRHEPSVAALCATYVRMLGEKVALDAQKSDVRARLVAYTKNEVKPYENRINALLDDFNAGFRICETKHSFLGGAGTSTYQLLIDRTRVDVGSGRTPVERPSFRNTLSAGDRTTLALAFFLAHLEREPARASRIVVFDDPFNSQDAFRRQQTVHQIRKAGEMCAQVFVLSHDASFLRQVWLKCPSDQRVAIQLVDHREQGSKIGPCDLDEACKGRVASEIDDLIRFDGTGAGELRDVIKKMRIVLETHCRATFPNQFVATQMLGEIVERIRSGGENHPTYHLLEPLELINDYTRQHHHGDDSATSNSGAIDDTELKGHVRRTLRIVNALQA